MLKLAAVTASAALVLTLGALAFVFAARAVANTRSGDSRKYGTEMTALCRPCVAPRIQYATAVPLMSVLAGFPADTNGAVTP